MDKKLFAELEKGLVIDRDSLDEEIIRHPAIFYRVSLAYMEAIETRDAAKDALTRMDAAIGIKLRQAAEGRGDKMTENKLLSQLQVHKDHVRATDKYLDARAFADKISALKESYQQKSYMLRSLVDLHVTGYFSIESGSSNRSRNADVVATSVRKKASERRKALKRF